MEDDDPKRAELIKYLFTLDKPQLISIIADVATDSENNDFITLCNSSEYEIRYYKFDLNKGKVEGITD